MGVSIGPACLIGRLYITSLPGTFQLAWNFSQVEVNFLLAVLIVRFNVFIFSLFYIGGREKLSYFWWMTILFICSMLLLITRGSMWILFIGWEGLGLTRFLLVAFYPRWKRNTRSIITAITNRIGDGVFLLFVAGGLLRFSSWWRWVWFPMRIGLILLTRLTKSAQFPFSVWLPAAMAAPTPISALVHSSTLVTAGFFLLFKRSEVFLTEYCQLVLLTVGFLTTMVRGLVAIAEKDVKKLVALSTLSQLGFLFIRRGTGLFWPAFFHLLTHAFTKRLLFITVGLGMRGSFSQDSRQFWRRRVGRRTAAIVALSSLCGLSFTSRWRRKDAILLQEVTNSTTGVEWGFSARIGLTFLYSARLLIAIKERYSTPASVVVVFSSTAGIRRIYILRILTIGWGWWFTNTYTVCVRPANRWEANLPFIWLIVIIVRGWWWLRSRHISTFLGVRVVTRLRLFLVRKVRSFLERTWWNRFIRSIITRTTQLRIGRISYPYTFFLLGSLKLL